MLKTTVIITVLFSLPFCLFGQIDIDSLNQNYDDLGIIELPTLQEAIDSAIANSPTIKMHEALHARSRFELEAYKSDWAKDFALIAETKLGNFGNNLALDNLSVGYGGGVGVRIPLSLIVGRKQNVNLRIQESIVRDQKRLEEIQYLKMEVARLYNDLVLKEKVLILNNEAYNNMKVNYQFAQLQFNDDQITIEAYTKVYDFYVKSMVSFEKSKTEYKSALFIFEEMIGVEISK